jgi:hypothetical protein
MTHKRSRDASPLGTTSRFRALSLTDELVALGLLQTGWRLSEVDQSMHSCPPELVCEVCHLGRPWVGLTFIDQAAANRALGDLDSRGGPSWIAYKAARAAIDVRRVDWKDVGAVKRRLVHLAGADPRRIEELEIDEEVLETHGVGQPRDILLCRACCARLDEDGHGLDGASLYCFTLRPVNPATETSRICREDE